MNHSYILYSKKLDRFYIGACHSDLHDRIAKHNDHAYGAHRYTAKANDWGLYLSIECHTFAMARRIELHIKKMKSSAYIKRLAEYPCIIEQLKDKYRDI
jgi:putative endonuclease